jgi:hypothetical protein
MAVEVRSMRAFGLDLDSDVAVPGASRPTGERMRPARLRLATQSEVESLWPPEGASQRCLHHFEDGSPAVLIEEHARVGFKLWGAGDGAHVVSKDGTEIVSAPEDPGDDRWLRFLIGQVLPLAALLQGLEIFHASAVAVDGGAVAFSGPSGSGKTSLALGLVDRGALFLADDVLALEMVDGQVVAHPGPAVAATLDGQQKRFVEVAHADGSHRLRALYLLEGPGPDAEPRLEPLREPHRLLGSTFNAIVVPPARLARLLDVCAAIGATARVASATTGSDGNLDELAETIAADLGVSTG